MRQHGELVGTDPEQYFRQLLHVATKGKVPTAWAVDEDRMILGCTECGAELRTQKQTDPHTLDYGVQEFIKLHAHNGQQPKTKSKPAEVLQTKTGRKFR